MRLIEYKINDQLNLVNDIFSEEVKSVDWCLPPYKKVRNYHIKVIFDYFRLMRKCSDHEYSSLRALWMNKVLFKGSFNPEKDSFPCVGNHLIKAEDFDKEIIAHLGQEFYKNKIYPVIRRIEELNVDIVIYMDYLIKKFNLYDTNKFD